jgi:DNA-binding IclR family transcriptional regulator
MAAGGGFLEKVFGLLDGLASANGSKRLIDLARQTGLAKSTAHRLLTMLCAHKLVERVGREYVLGERLARLTELREAQKLWLLRQVTTPHLVNVYEHTGAMTLLGIPRGAEVQYLERIYGLGPVNTPSQLTDKAPAHCTAVGKVLMAFQPDALSSFLDRGGMLEARTRHTITSVEALETELVKIRREGVAFSREEYVNGVVCVAAPVIGRHGRPVASVAIGDLVSRFQPQRAEHQIRRVAHTASLAIRRTGPAIGG